MTGLAVTLLCLVALRGTLRHCADDRPRCRSRNRRRCSRIAPERFRARSATTMRRSTARVASVPPADYLRFAREQGRGRDDPAAPAHRPSAGTAVLVSHQPAARWSPTGEQRAGDDLRDPPLTITSMRTVILDTRRPLVEFHAVPPQLEIEQPTRPTPPQTGRRLFDSRTSTPRRLPARRATRGRRRTLRRRADGVGRTDARLAGADSQARRRRARTAGGSSSCRR